METKTETYDLPESRVDAINEWASAFGSDPLDSLAASLFVNSDNPQGRLIGMFTAYLDAAGNSLDQPFVIVSGYIANFYQWKMFGSVWKSIHEHRGVNLPFHMADFIAAHERPEQYARQRKCRRDYVELAKDKSRSVEFFKEICLAHQLLNCGISCVIDMGVYKSVCAGNDLRELLPPYALAARLCLVEIHRWEDQFGVENPVECVFERGDLEQSKFTKLIASEGAPAPIYKHGKDFPGLQAADQYAWEQFYHAKKQLTGDKILARESFKYLINSIPKIHVEVTREGLLGLCKSFGINTSVQ